jgi:hypothetical protein
MQRLFVAFIIIVTALTASLIWPSGTSAEDSSLFVVSYASRATDEASVVNPGRHTDVRQMSQSDEAAKRCVHQCFVDTCLPIPSAECHQRCQRRCGVKE